MPAVRFINLDRALERRAFMERQAEALGLEVERVRAAEPGDVTRAEMERLQNAWQRRLSPGEVACFLSHKRQWQRVAVENRPALILEDDAVLSPRLPAVLGALEGLAGAELLNLEDVGRKRFLEKGPGRPLASDVRALRCLRDKAGAGAYILWPQGARRLLARVGEGAGLADAVLHGAGLAAFVCEPPVCQQLSVLALRGLPTPIDPQSLLEPERAAAPRAASWRFAARRMGAQIALAPNHLRRLAGRVVYRAVRVDEGDFAPPEACDHRRS